MSFFTDQSMSLWVFLSLLITSWTQLTRFTFIGMAELFSITLEFDTSFL